MNDAPRNAARSSFIPWGVETDAVTNAVLDLRGYGRAAAGSDGGSDGEAGSKPTTGFHAVVSMALACRSVRLYGFQGETPRLTQYTHSYCTHTVHSPHALCTH